MDTDIDKNENDPNVENDVPVIKEATSNEDNLEIQLDGDVCERAGEPQVDGVDKKDEVIYIDVEVDKETTQVIFLMMFRPAIFL